MYRGFLIGVLAGGFLLNGGTGIAAASTPSPALVQLCAEDAQALRSFAEQAPGLTPTLRTTVARLIVRYKHLRARCGRSVRIPTGGGGYASVSLLTAVPTAHIAPRTPAVVAARSPGGGHALVYFIASVASVVLVLALVYVRRGRPRRRSSTAR